MTHYRESMQQTLERMYEINERKKKSLVELNKLELPATIRSKELKDNNKKLSTKILPCIFLMNTIL